MPTIDPASGGLSPPQSSRPPRRAFPGGLAAQIVLTLVTWGFLCGLQPHNDGLWYPGDAPRHAANGLFLKDYFAEGMPNPSVFMKAYDARYPVISPIKYPPGFYVVEAAAYALFGARPEVAVACVLVFALLAAAYAMAWLRRWVAPEAGYLAAIVPILPGMVTYSHAIMLNVPSVALCFAALYHTRRWIEEPAPRRLYAMAASGVLAIAIYQAGIVLVPVIVAWMFVARRQTLLLRPQVLKVVGIAVLVLMPYIFFLITRSEQVSWAFNTPHLMTRYNWTHYGKRFPLIFGSSVLVVAMIGLVWGLISPKRRDEVRYSGSCLAVFYLFFGYLHGKDIRYMMPLALPLLALSSIPIVGVTEFARRWFGQVPARIILGAAVLGLIAWYAVLAKTEPSREITGIRAAADFIARTDPDANVLIEGPHESIFTFLMLVDDPDFRRSVRSLESLGRYAGADRADAWRAYGPTPERAAESLLTQSGCRWVVLEVTPTTTDEVATRIMERLVREGRSEMVRSFPVVGPSLTHLRVYRRIGPVANLAEFKVPPGVRLPDPKWFTRRRIERRGRSRS